MIYGSDYLYFLYFPFQSMFKNDNAYDYKQLVFFRKARIYTETWWAIIQKLSFVL